MVINSMLSTEYGVIHSYDMTAASVHDLHYLKDLPWECHDCMILGDKGYLSAQVQQNLFDVANITLVVLLIFGLSETLI